MASLVVSAVADGCEFLFTVFAVIGLLASVSSHVYKKVAFFGEDLATVFNFALKEVLT